MSKKKAEKTDAIADVLKYAYGKIRENKSIEVLYCEVRNDLSEFFQINGTLLAVVSTLFIEAIGNAIISSMPSKSSNAPSCYPLIYVLIYMGMLAFVECRANSAHHFYIFIKLKAEFNSSSLREASYIYENFDVSGGSFPNVVVLKSKARLDKKAIGKMNKLLGVK